MKIKLSGTKNIRDFSEYGLPGYIRSAHLHDIIEQDAGLLVEKYELKTVIDLRTSMEMKEKPDCVIPGVEYIHMPLFDEARLGISHEKAVDKEMIAKTIPDMTTLYRSLVTEKASVGQTIRRLFRTILKPMKGNSERCYIIFIGMVMSLLNNMG